MVKNLVENACSGFCALSHSLCVNMRRTLAQNWHTFVPRLFMENGDDPALGIPTS